MNRHLLYAAPLVGAFVIWAATGEPAASAGLIVLAVSLALTWPFALLALVVGVPYWCALLVPRHWRASYRARSDRNSQPSQRIRAAYQRAIWAGDRSRCVFCGLAVAGHDRHIDHRVPWSFGGLSALPNLFVLCSTHNLIKFTFWIDERGIEHGRSSDRDLARDIFAAERRAGRSLLRWARIAWALS